MPTTDIDGYLGKFLNNRYLIKSLIGKGGMGRVYLAEDIAKAGTSVAIKILNLNLVNQQMSQRFAREIFIGAQLGRKSKHIVRLLSYGMTEERVPFYVMEYLQGKNLKEFIKTNNLTIKEIVIFSHQICLGLQCAHQGVSYKGDIYPVIHRDIKPENIFITEDSRNNIVIKILDFGIAKFLTERSGMTWTDSFIGSLPYCSPEHMEGRKLLDVRSDIYSLGVLMYEMITGEHPFSINTQSFGSWYQAHRFQMPPAFEEVNPQVIVPQELRNLVMICLAKEVKARPENVSQILETLEKIQRLPDKASDREKISPESSQVKLIPVTALSEKLCLEKKWPTNKPKALICFPYLLHTSQGTIPTFWAMLPKKEITKFLNQINATEFIGSTNLHPILLWITVLCDTKFELTRWLSYCLDLKDYRGQKILRLLADVGYYHLLLFALEEASDCSNVITITLPAVQRQQLIDLLEDSQKFTSVISFQESKKILKIQYEKMKPDILQKIILRRKSDKMAAKNWVFKLFNKIFFFILSERFIFERW